jgi:spermidine synthase
MTRFVALALTVLTGFAGLVYEVTWQKYLATLLGSHGEATAAVLAIFLGGLALGYSLFGRLTRRMVVRGRERGRSPRLLYAYALVESGIGLYALAFPLLFGLAQAFSLIAPAGPLGFAFDVVLAALLIGPPTVAMGATIPILTLALAGDVEHSTRVHAWVYGFNTFGAFAGALAAGFVLIPWLGLDGVMWSMACVNLVSAAIFAQLDRRAPEIAPEAAAATAGAPVTRFPAWAGVALLAGFAMMALQTTLNRLGALALGSSQFTFAMVVAVFVLAIALGSLAVSALPRIPRGVVLASQWGLVGLLFGLYGPLGDAAYWAHTVRALFREIDPAFYAYHAMLLGLLLAILLVPIGLSGALLPLLFHQLRREVRDLGAVAGRLYAWNTLGSLLGALLGGYVLLLWLDLHHVYRIALAALAGSAGLLTFLLLRRASALVAAGLVAPALLASGWLPAWAPERLAAGSFRNRQPLEFSFAGPDAFFAQRRRGSVVFYEDDPTSSVAVLEPEGGPEERGIFVNGKPDGNLKGDYATMALSGLLPALMAERYEHSFVIGWGTGVTTGELAALEASRRVRVAEISRGVLAAAPLFDVGNLAASRSPKVEVRQGDAYRTLLQSEDEYDLIVSEPSNPWVSGVEMLYSLEFLTAARARLAPGGVYAQWFHVYESDPDVVALVLRNYAAVFPRVSVWFALGADLLLLGFDREERALDVDRLARRFEQPDFAAGFARVGIERFAQLLDNELLPLGTLHAAPLPGDHHTLRHPILSHRAARAFFRGELASLPRFLKPPHTSVAAQNSLMRRWVRSGGASAEEALAAATRETCRFDRREECATLFARWQRDHPDSPRLAAALERARRRQSGKNPQLRPKALARLATLFGGKLAPLDGQKAMVRANQVAGLYVQNYVHAAPFDRSVLSAAWEACRAPACDERRERLEERVGPLDGSAAEGW